MNHKGEVRVIHAWLGKKEAAPEYKEGLDLNLIRRVSRRSVGGSVDES